MNTHLFETVAGVTDDDFRQLVKNMRAEDVLELTHGSRDHYVKVVRDGIDQSSSVIYTMRQKKGGEVMAVYGVITSALHPGQGVPWMLATEAVRKYPKEMIHFSRTILKTWRQRWSVLVNFVDVENKVSIRYLRMLGFTLEAPASHGPRGEPFCKFYWRR